ncbi:MAG: polyprenyl synthetase family protein [Dehalococcoidia bacterium]
MTVASLYGPVQADLSNVETTLAEVKSTDFPALSRMLEHVLGGAGKRMRPALALLAGRYQDYNLEQLVPLAASVELLHTATLVHDDVIDVAATRRGRATANSLYDNAASVMLGDFMFAHAADLVARTGNLRVIRLFSRTLMRIATGELDQDVSAFDWSKGVRDYFSRIGGKTASLFATACEGGAIISGAPESWIEALRDYGYNLGVAFQIVDDILDFTGNEGEMGKPVGSDLMQGTLTLPALLLMEGKPHDNAIKRLFQARRLRERRLAEAVEAVRNSDGLQRSRAMAQEFAGRARTALEPLPHDEVSGTLMHLIGYVLDRQS